MKSILAMLAASLFVLAVSLPQAAEAGPFVIRSKTVVVNRNARQAVVVQRFVAPQAFLVPGATFVAPQAFAVPQQSFSLQLNSGYGVGGVQSFRQSFSAGGGCGALLIR